MFVNCSDCIFWVEEENSEFGQCRRKAPIPINSAGKGGSFIGPYNYRVIWPYTRNVDGCGEGAAGKKIVVRSETRDQTIVPERKATPKSFDDMVKEQMRKK